MRGACHMMDAARCNACPAIAGMHPQGSGLTTAQLGLQVTSSSLLTAYEELLSPEERAHVLAGASAAVRKERLLARVLVRTTLSR